jgi:hypothetical protein
MHKIRDVLRLRADGLSKRKIAASLSIGVTTAGKVIRRAKRAGLRWPLPEDLSDEALERLVYPPVLIAAKDRRPQPDWPNVHRELRRPGVTLQLLWEEYRDIHPDGYGYSRYCDLYCGKCTSPASECLSIMPARRWMSWTGQSAKCTRVNCLSPYSGHPTTPMRK